MNKDLNKIDKQIELIQRSTRTTIRSKALSVIHNYLRRIFKFYYHWHLKSYCGKVHIGVLIVYTISMIFGAVNFLLLDAKNTKATNINIQALPVSFTETDWSNTNYASSTAETDLFSGNLLLKNNYSNFVEAFDPTTQTIITDLKAYNNKLYIGATTNLFEDPNGQIYSYDYKTNSSSLAYTCTEQGMEDLQIVNNKLMTAGVDTTIAPNTTGSLYIYDGNGWSKKTTITNALHTDSRLYKLGNDIYVHSINSAVQALYKTSNEGDSWTLARFRDQSIEFWNKMLGVFNGKLWIGGFKADINKDGLFSWDGTNMDFVPVTDGANLAMIHFMGYFGGKYYVGGGSLSNKSSLYVSSDLINFSPISTFAFSTNNSHTASMIEIEGKIFVSGYKLITGSDPIGYIYNSIDGGNTWNKIIDNIPSYFADSGEWQTRKLPMTNYAGRLYIGTADNGKVYVSSSQPSGELISKPKQLDNFNKLTLNWNAIKPAGTNIKFQVRYATTEAEFSSATFVGPDKTSNTHFTTSGTSIDHLPQSSYVQYKVIMDTADSKFTPYLEDVTINSDNVLGATNISPFTIEYGLGYYTDEDLTALATNYKYLISHDRYSPNKVNQLRQINPDLKILKYRNGLVIDKTTAAYADIAANHPTWFLYDVPDPQNLTTPYDESHRIHETGWPNNYLLNPNNQEWKDYRRDEFITLMSSSNPTYDGIFMDVMQAWIKEADNYCYYNHVPINPATGLEFTNAEWRQANYHFMEYIKNNAINPYPGKILIFNGIGTGQKYFNYSYPDDYGYRKFLDVADGALIEGFTRWGDNPINSFRSETPWKQDVDALKEVADLGKINLTMSDVWQGVVATPNELKKYHYYSLSSYLLARGGDSYYNFRQKDETTATKPQPYNNIWSTEIGLPTGEYQLQGNLYERNFTNGKVVVNPNPTNTYNLDLGGFYRTLDGNIINSYTFTPNTGMVFTLDSTPPSVSIIRPTSNATVSNSVDISSSASDNVGISKIEFYIDNTIVSTQTTAGQDGNYGFSWNSRSVSNGNHTLKAIAYDTSNNTNEAFVSVNVHNLSCNGLSSASDIANKLNPLTNINKTDNWNWWNNIIPKDSDCTAMFFNEVVPTDNTIYSMLWDKAVPQLWTNAYYYTYLFDHAIPDKLANSFYYTRFWNKAVPEYWTWGFYYKRLWDKAIPENWVPSSPNSYRTTFWTLAVPSNWANSYYSSRLWNKAVPEGWSNYHYYSYFFDTAVPSNLASEYYYNTFWNTAVPNLQAGGYYYSKLWDKAIPQNWVPESGPPGTYSYKWTFWIKAVPNNWSSSFYSSRLWNKAVPQNWASSYYKNTLNNEAKPGNWASGYYAGH